MILLALLRMLFAMEPLVRVDAASERMALNCVTLFCCEISSSSHSSASSSCCSLLFLIQNLQRINMTMPMKATPPITPPAIAPTFVFCEAGAGLGFAIHVICAHALQSLGTSEQIWPLGQSGHVGVSVGHLTHLLKIVRRFRSTSCGMELRLVEAMATVTALPPISPSSFQHTSAVSCAVFAVSSTVLGHQRVLVAVWNPQRRMPRVLDLWRDSHAVDCLSSNISPNR